MNIRFSKRILITILRKKDKLGFFFCIDWKELYWSEMYGNEYLIEIIFVAHSEYN